MWLRVVFGEGWLTALILETVLGIALCLVLSGLARGLRGRAGLRYVALLTLLVAGLTLALARCLGVGGSGAAVLVLVFGFGYVFIKGSKSSKRGD